MKAKKLLEALVGKFECDIELLRLIEGATGQMPTYTHPLNHLKTAIEHLITAKMWMNKYLHEELK